MKVISILIMSAVMLLTLACGKTTESNALQNEPGGTPKIETSINAVGNAAVNNSSNIVNNPFAEAETGKSRGEKISAMKNISITVGDSIFSAKLYDNDAANNLLTQFPMTLNMSELNGNEKYYYLAGNLPFESTEKPATINAGDIMCWSGNCLVLFYRTVSNSYGGYVRLGYIEDVSGLADALGDGSIQVLFTISK